MNDAANPYAAPTADIHPVAAEWLGSRPASLDKVAMGLGLIYTGIVAILLAIITQCAVPHLPIGNDLAALISRCVGFAIIGGGLLDLIGSLMCLATPEETGARGFIYASVAAMLLLTFVIVAEVLQLMGYIGELPSVPGYVQIALGIVSTMSFILFLRKLAQFIGRSDLESRAKGVLTYYCVLIAGQLGLILYLKAGGRLPNEVWMGLVAFLIAVVVYAIALVIYANLVLFMRKAILSGGRG